MCFHSVETALRSEVIVTDFHFSFVSELEAKRGRVAQNVLGFLLISLAARSFCVITVMRPEILREEWQVSSWLCGAVNHSGLTLALPLTAAHHFLALRADSEIDHDTNGWSAQLCSDVSVVLFVFLSSPLFSDGRRDFYCEQQQLS